jgi:DNA-binding transcriptional ArsR family regulator
MVERYLDYNMVFGCLADGTRRDILELVSQRALSIRQIARHSSLTYGAISKHILYLERANLVVKKRRGKDRLVMADTSAIEEAEEFLRHYRLEMTERLDRFAEYIIKEKEK